MRMVRNRAANWLRRELLRGISDYLDERDDDAGGCRRVRISGPGGYRGRLVLRGGVRMTGPTVRPERLSAGVLCHCWT